MLFENLDVGTPEIPKALLPLVPVFLPLEDIDTALTACRELYGLAVTEDATEFLEGKLIDANLERLRFEQVALVEWGPDWALGEEYNAAVYVLPIQGVGELIVVRWWDDVPHWWSYGESVGDMNAVINSLERKVGRTYNRVVWQRAER
jgi:hypothetical protein